MKFDVIIGNPPYQSNVGNGDLKGSGTGALWLKFTEMNLNMLKPGGYISYITPTNIINGGDAYSKMVLGSSRKVDLKKVETSVNNHFPKVGTSICRWVAQNSITEDNQAEVDGEYNINTGTTLKIYDDATVQSIIQTMFDYSGEKFDISVKNTADPRAISRKIQKTGVSKSEADKIAKDYTSTPDDDHPYAYNSNGKIKYGRVKWKTYGQWKMMIPHMGKPFTYEIIVSDVIVPDQSCDTQYFDTEEEALKVKAILDNPLYRWVIEQTRTAGRMSTATLSKLPNAPIEEVLSKEQLDYIRSQLPQ